jgi:hypothetical protein
MRSRLNLQPPHDSPPNRQVDKFGDFAIWRHLSTNRRPRGKRAPGNPTRKRGPHSDGASFTLRITNMRTQRKQRVPPLRACSLRIQTRTSLRRISCDMQSVNSSSTCKCRLTFPSAPWSPLAPAHSIPDQQMANNPPNSPSNHASLRGNSDRLCALVDQKKAYFTKRIPHQAKQIRPIKFACPRFSRKQK